MRMVIVSIHDSATSVFGRPVFVASEGAAIRSFGDEIQRDDPNNEMFRHPGDFDLFRLGAYDDNSGELQPEFPPVLLVKGSSLKG